MGEGTTKSFASAMFVLVGILLGVAFVVNQTNNPKLDSILSTQTKILQNQQSGGAGQQAGGKIEALENRIAALENQLKGLQGLQGLAQALQAQQAGGQGAAAARPQQAPPAPDMNTVYTIPVDQTPIIGKKDAPVTITEFMDFQCPFCGRFHPDAASMVKQYPGKVRMLVKNFPLSFHPNADPAAKAALAANEQGKYDEMVEKLIANQQNLSEDMYKKIAKEIGLNEKKFWDDYTNKAADYDKIIQKDQQLGQQVGVRGTPTYYINGRQTNARDANSWKQEIEAELNKKK